MKKVILFCFLLVFSSQFYAQDAAVGSKVLKEKKEKVVLEKKKVDKEVKDKKETAADKKKKMAEEAKAKKDGTEAKKKDVAKEVKTTKETVSKTTATTVKATKAKVVAKDSKVKENAVVVKDKASGTYNGKTVYTGPKGGKYYINKNGNKTYIDNK